MRVSVFLLLCAVSGGVLADPVSETSGRGFGSSLWSWTLGWWWPAEAAPPAPAPPADSNVTVRCGEQTCTTVRCARGRCETTTCGIYDTDTSGRCRVYNVTQLTTPATEATAAVATEVVPAAGAAAEKPQAVQLVAATEENTPKEFDLRASL